jgi:hypothetical protein
MAGPGGDSTQRFENLIARAREAVDQYGPGVLDTMAATARNIAERLDDMAIDARQRAAEKEATRKPGPTEPATPATAATADDVPEPPGEPPASSGYSGTTGA